jgi:hypothetical protein
VKTPQFFFANVGGLVYSVIQRSLFFERVRLVFGDVAMKRIHNGLLPFLCMGLAVGLLALEARAQTVHRAATGVTAGGATVGLRSATTGGGDAAPVAAIGGQVGGPVVRLRRLPKLARASLLQRTPEYTTSVARSARRPREWAVFDIPYDTAAEWIDDLSFTLTVLTKHQTPDGKTEYGLFQSSVHYGDVPRGDHLAGFVMPGVAFLRYGDPVAMAVEATSGDGGAPVVDTVILPAANIPADLQKDWWKNPKITDNASVVKHAGYLVDRSKSPFALINVDDYEAVK